MIRIKKGLDLPVDAKAPANQYGEVIDKREKVKKIAVIGTDYVGMKPTLSFKKGDNVRKGMPLFKCKKTDRVVYTSPGSGKIGEVNRGKRRAFQSIVVELDNSNDEVSYKNYSKDPKNYTKESIRELLIESGLWTSLRQRPFSKVPAVDSQPKTVFITAMDTNPLMYDPEIIISKYIDDFKTGARILATLTRGRVFICTKEDTRLDISYDGDLTPKKNSIPKETTQKDSIPKDSIPRESILKNVIMIKKFAGIHPAGNPGTHIHFLSPNSLKTTTWYIGFQDVIAIGKLFKHGKLWTDRYVSLAGTGITTPVIIKTRLGASMSDFLSGISIDPAKNRIISGSLFNGFEAKGAFAYLGRYFNQVSVISNQVEQDFLGWLSPGIKRFSVMPTFLSKILHNSKFNFNTGVNGSSRAMVPIGAYEKVMPLDTLPTQLLRALLVKDSDMAMDLGVLDLDEEDFALCTFVDPGKIDYGPVLRELLTQIEMEEM